jgi:hypothetical protein
MEKSLYAAVSHSFWHGLWTNATHDDRDYTIARMLAWQAYLLGKNAPFKGRNLYSLLMFGKLHPLLRSLPWKKTSSSSLQRFNPLEDHAEDQPARLEAFPADRLLHDVREFMGRLCDEIVGHMSMEERQDYDDFWQEVRAFYITELEAREQYNGPQ